MEMKGLKKYFYFILPVLGVLFYLLYLHTSAIDMVYSDYIRLINSYLPDIWDPRKFFVPDLLTRIPVNYLERAINVTLFGYSVTLLWGIGLYYRRLQLSKTDLFRLVCGNNGGDVQPE